MGLRNLCRVVSVLMVLVLTPHSSAQAASDQVAIVTFEDVASNVKSRLFRTNRSNCQRHLHMMKNQLEAQVGIAKIVSAKCGPIGALGSFFDAEPMGVPYLWSSKREVLVIRGASAEACFGLASMILGAVCVMP